MGLLDWLLGKQRGQVLGVTVRDHSTVQRDFSRTVSPRFPNLCAIVDVETTGLDAGEDEILELAIVLFDFDRATGKVGSIREQYVGLREPECQISKEASSVHGITRNMVKGQFLDIDRIQSMLDRAEEVIAHNASFDKSFVRQLFPSEGSRWWLCSMSGIDWRRRGHASRKLQDLAEFYGIRTNGAHRALADVMMIHQMLGHSNGYGRSYLADLLQDSTRDKPPSRPAQRQNPLSRSQRKVTEKHFQYQYEIQSEYKNRDYPKSFKAAVAACEKQIAMATEVAEVLRWEFPDQTLPAHVGFTQLAIIREKEGNLDEAIRLCKLAMEQGWAGEWESRIARCEKRLAKAATAPIPKRLGRPPKSNGEEV